MHGLIRAGALRAVRRASPTSPGRPRPGRPADSAYGVWINGLRLAAVAIPARPHDGRQCVAATTASRCCSSPASRRGPTCSPARPSRGGRADHEPAAGERGAPRRAGAVATRTTTPASSRSPAVATRSRELLGAALAGAQVSRPAAALARAEALASCADADGAAAQLRATALSRSAVPTRPGRWSRGSPSSRAWSRPAAATRLPRPAGSTRPRQGWRGRW